MIVAIDGPAGSGKSTVARAVAAQRELTFLDTGAMYRTVTLSCLRKQIDVTDTAAVAQEAKDITVTFSPLEDGGAGVFLNGEDVSDQIRTAEVDASVSAVAAIPEVREAMVEQQRALSCGLNVVAEGRDIGTVVFPQADVKVFLTASPEARAHRRAVERAGSDVATNPQSEADPTEEAAILAAIKERDEADSTRKAAPLKAADDAVTIDSSDLTLTQVVAHVVELYDQAAAKQEDETAAEQPASSEGKERKPGREKAQDAPKRDKKANKEPMRLFGNSFESYHNHDMREYPITSRIFYHVLLGLVGFASKIYFRWTIEDAQKLDTALSEGGCVVISNHCASIDPIFLMIHAWAHGQRLRPIYKSEFDKNKAVTWLFSRVGGIPVERGNADMNMVRCCRSALRRGESILVYPEGTRVRSDEEQVEIHGGFALLAQMGKAKVVPTAEVGARNIKPQGTLFPRPVKVVLKSADAISFEELGVRGRKPQLAAMEKRAMDEVWSLRAELRCEYPGKL